MKSKMLKVRFLVNTAYQGPRKEGEEIYVPEDFASRWAKNSIAEIVTEGEKSDQHDVTEEEVVADEAPDEEEAVKEEDNHDYSNMNAKDLYALCKQKGIEVEAKRSKEYYLEKLA